MSEENQYIEEVGDIAPKPSAVRRSGKIDYARRQRYRSLQRPGLNPPTIKRVTAQPPAPAAAAPSQPVKSELPPPEPTTPEAPGAKDDQEVNPAVIDAEDKTTLNADQAVEKVVGENSDSEEKKLDIPDPPAVLDEIMHGLEEPASTEDKEDAPNTSFMDTFEEIQGKIEEQDGQSEAVPVSPEAPKEPESKVPVVQPSSRKPVRSRVYTRPHTNQTVVVGASNDDNDNDSKSTASGLSQPSWGGKAPARTEQTEEEEEESQTSLGNQKRRARIARRKKKSAKLARPSPDAGNAGVMGYVVSQFDNMLGYGGSGRRNKDEDGYSSEESENIMTDLQDVLMSTFGCAVPQQTKSRKNLVDDESTVDTNNTGGQSNHSSVRHVRSGSNLSGSLYSTISGSGVGSVLSFDTTEELADFRDKRTQSGLQSTGSYKVPDAYDPNPPRIPHQRTAENEMSAPKPLYSEDLYASVLQPDFEPVDLLEEGDSMLDLVGKDIMSVASSQAQEVITQIQDFLSTKSTEEDSPTVTNTLSNVTEPLGVITENEGEASPGRKSPLEEKFEVNVFEDAAKETQENPTTSKDSTPSTDRASEEGEDSVSVFQGLDDQESQLLEPEKEETEEAGEVEINPADDEIDPAAEEEVKDSLIKPSESAVSKTEEGVITLNPTQGTDSTPTTAASSQKTATGSIGVDREGPGSSPPVPTEEDSKGAITPASPPSVQATAAATPVASQSKAPEKKKPAVKTKKDKTSFEAALAAPETKKSKKFSGLKGLFRIKKKKKKGSKKSSTVPLAQQSELAPQEPETPKVTKVTPAAASPEVTAPVEPAPEEPVASEQPDPPAGEGDEESKETPPLSCPTTPVRVSENMDTPKMSNLVSEARKLTRPVSGTNLADLPGIDEANSFREDPPAASQNEEVVPTDQPDPSGFDGRPFGEPLTSFQTQTVKMAVSAKSFDEDAKEVSFESFNLDLSADVSWESFGDKSDDIGHAAFRQKALEDAKMLSPQKVTAFPAY